ncbi:hypothetical protein [Leptolyngbya sp. FACHB-8]|nr:hypothetical protein [Leptolyngbya sp. FACHB-8]MBD1912989.1 hypothetical protein [Leptolyngbya sp. FACHB-8]
MRPILNQLPVLIAVLTLSLGGCSPSKSNETATPVPVSPSLTASSPATSATPAAPNVAQLVAEAKENATQAATLSQSAQSRDDWALVSSRWQRAIALLSRIPEGAPEAAKAQQDLATYRRNLAEAQQQASQPLNRQPVRLARPEADASPADGSSPSPDASPSGDGTASPEASPSPGESPSPGTSPSPGESPSPGTSPSPGESPSPQANLSQRADVTAEVALANHLQQTGARMYAAYWCGYCQRQQAMFGSEAVQQLEIVECDPRGTNPQVDRCRTANVGSFPTWQINGRLYPGLQSMTRLADLSGYSGPRTFRN